VQLVVDADATPIADQYEALRTQLGCSLREARSTVELLDLLRATLRRRLPLSLELEELDVVLRRRAGAN
jgi:hypothetical protein